MSKGSVRRPGTIPAGAWEAIFNADPVYEPVTMGEDQQWCDPQCPYLEGDFVNMAMGKCKRDGQPLHFYDWFLAHCNQQQIDPDEPCRPQCGDCGGTRRVKGEPCPSCAPTDADDVPND